MFTPYSQEYRDWARYYLFKKFPNLTAVDAALAAHNGHFLPALKHLAASDATAANVEQAKRPAAALQQPARPYAAFLREYIYLRLEAEVERAVQSREEQRQARVAAAKASGAVFECACCFDEDCPLDEVKIDFLTKRTKKTGISI
jgi:hypothetical protein